MRTGPGGRRKPVRNGFTLIELMISVGIIAILAAVGYSAFSGQTMRSKRSEATMGLKGIYKSQLSYLAASGTFGDTFDELGFTLEGATRVDARTLRGKTYTFTVRALPDGANPRGNFQAIATGDLDPGDGVLDVLMIENGLSVGP